VGVWDLPAATEAIGQGEDVYWDADGDPVGGTAGSGACTATSTDNTLIGKAMVAKASGGALVRVKLNV
jgi:predicted RecA/RadA family phage recombinase